MTVVFIAIHMQSRTSLYQKMPQYDDNSKLQLNHKKRSRWNNDDDDYDDGEIPESDTAHAVALGGTKRLRPTTTLSDSYETDHYRGISVTNFVSEDQGTFKNPIKKSREELERERQIRMAAIRGETEIKETSNDGHTGSTNNHTTQQYDPLATNTTSNNQKTKKKASKRNRDDGVNQSKKTTMDTDDQVNMDDENDDDDDDDETTKAMEELFGITNFGSTKNTKVITNHTSAAIGTVAKHLKPRKYRQYMNRKNGFNRPLDNV